MPAKSPEDIDIAFSDAFNAGDGEAMLALYEPGAIFVGPTGDLAEGIAAIAETVGPFFAMKPRIDLRTEKVLRTGDLAMVYSSWTVNGTGEDGSPVEMTGNSTIVCREQSDGTWKLVLDDPGWNPA